MPRVKRGVTAGRRHKKVLDQAKGYYGARSKIYRVAKQAVIKAGQTTDGNLARGGYVLVQTGESKSSSSGKLFMKVKVSCRKLCDAAHSMCSRKQIRLFPYKARLTAVRHRRRNRSSFRSDHVTSSSVILSTIIRRKCRASKHNKLTELD